MRVCTLPATVALAMLVTGTLDAASSGLSEREAQRGPSGGPPAATPPAIRKDAGSSRSLSSPRRIEGIDVRGWHNRAVRNRRQINRMRHTYLQHPSVVEAVNLACATYGHCAELWSKARCESRLNHRARNLSSGAAGLFQWLPSSWRTTPYGRFDIYSPYASALAAGWAHANGHGSWWECR